MVKAAIRASNIGERLRDQLVKHWEKLVIAIKDTRELRRAPGKPGEHQDNEKI